MTEQKRIGAASILISISDADGFRVAHGTDKATLRYIPADKMPLDAWSRLWQVIEEIAP